MDDSNQQNNPNNNVPGVTSAPAANTGAAAPQPVAPATNAMPAEPQPTAQKITTTVTCPKCGHQHEVSVEVPEKQETTKMTWAK